MERFSYWCAQASRLAYLSSEEIISKIRGTDLKSLEIKSPLHGSYRGVCFIHHELKLIIVAHRGTDPNNLHNLLADAALALGDIPLESEVARDFSATIRDLATKSGYDDYQIIETGHSLGGFLAELNAVHFDDRSITFESPGIKKVLDKNNIKPSNKAFSNILTYLAAPNPINTSNGHIGKIVRLHVPHVTEKSIAFKSSDVLAVISNIPTLLAALANPSSLPVILSEKLFNAIVDFVGRLPRGLSEYYLNQHSIESLLSCFSIDSQAPHLQLEMQAWPSLLDYLCWLSNTDFLGALFAHITNLDKQELKRVNIAIERMINDVMGYSLGEFTLPPKRPQDSKDQFYAHNVLQQFSTFYTDEKMDKFQLFINHFEYKGLIPQLTKGDSMRLATEAERTQSEVERKQGNIKMGGAVSGGIVGGVLVASTSIATAGVVAAVPGGAAVFTLAATSAAATATATAAASASATATAACIAGTGSAATAAAAATTASTTAAAAAIAAAPIVVPVAIGIVIGGVVVGYFLGGAINMCGDWTSKPLKERQKILETEKITLQGELSNIQNQKEIADAIVAQLRADLAAERLAHEKSIKGITEKAEKERLAHEKSIKDLTEKAEKERLAHEKSVQTMATTTMQTLQAMEAMEARMKEMEKKMESMQKPEPVVSTKKYEQVFFPGVQPKQNQSRQDHYRKFNA